MFVSVQVRLGVPENRITNELSCFKTKHFIFTINKMQNIDVLDFIKAIRESFSSSVVVYTYGNCYQFYEILKCVYSEAEAYYDGNHVWTKIDGKYYDITGELKLEGKFKNINLRPIIDNEQIASLSKNKWSDERRKDYYQDYKKHLNKNISCMSE